MRPGDRQFQRPVSHMSAVCVGKPACSKPLAFRKVALTPASTVPSQSDGKPNVSGSHFVVYFIPPTATPSAGYYCSRQSFKGRAAAQQALLTDKETEAQGKQT